MPRSSPHFSTELSLHNTSYANFRGPTVESAVGLLSPVPGPWMQTQLTGGRPLLRLRGKLRFAQVQIAGEAATACSARRPSCGEFAFVVRAWRGWQWCASSSIAPMLRSGTVGSCACFFAATPPSELSLAGWSRVCAAWVTSAGLGEIVLLELALRPRVSGEPSRPSAAPSPLGDARHPEPIPEPRGIGGPSHVVPCLRCRRRRILPVSAEC